MMNDNMGRNEIITSAEGRSNAPLEIYKFPPEAGCFIGTLAYRAWHPKKQCLVCYFDTDSGEHFRLMAWWKSDNAKPYRPKNGVVSFADDVVNGSRWKCVFGRAKGGSITWLTAEELLGQ